MRYVGWDWASRTHDVTVLGETGTVLERWVFAHTEAGWAATIHRLRRHGDPNELPVIIERTRGLVVDRLLEAGHPVVPVHPTSFYATRPRWSASGTKSGPGDSYKLTDYLRTDSHRLRRLELIEARLPAWRSQNRCGRPAWRAPICLHALAQEIGLPCEGSRRDPPKRRSRSFGGPAKPQIGSERVSSSGRLVPAAC